MKPIVTAEFIQRTFKIKCGSKLGTFFLVSLNGSQFYITAEHLVCDHDEFPVEIHTDIGFQKISFEKIVCGSDLSGRRETDLTAPDVALIKIPQMPDLDMTVPIHKSTYYFGADAYFIGFPLDLQTAALPKSQGWLSPFVKRGCISAFASDKRIFYVDGTNNAGFSGGPVITRDENSKSGVCIGVVSGYVREHQQVHSTENWYRDTEYLAQSNSNICVATSIEFVKELALEL